MKRLLLVDDDKGLLEILTLLFEEEGFDVLARPDGSHFYEDVKNFHPDAVLMDLKLPGKFGDVVLQEAKKKNSVHFPPVIMMSSAYDLPERAKQSQADDYVSKPFDFGFIIDKVKEKVEN